MQNECVSRSLRFVFFFNDTATTEIYTLSLHDALPIFWRKWLRTRPWSISPGQHASRSEEHTSELQSRFGISYAVFCLKKKIQSAATQVEPVSMAADPDAAGGALHTHVHAHL